MIAVQNLTKRYGEYTAVDDVSFTCQPGQVTGFLGPNGAGKTTTMRIIAGLTSPTRGSAQIETHEYRDIPNPATQVGVLLDASAQHAGRTGREVLTLGAMTMGLGSSRVDEMLELVSLTPAESKRRLKNYSLGMRQRLGIAHALLGNPKIMILDEPANGLDPAGIHWMRGLLREYANDGGTVLLSSHLLHEVQMTADQIIVIGNGRIVAEGGKDELLQQAGTIVRSAESATLAQQLSAAGFSAIRSGADGLNVEAAPEEVGKVAASGGIALTELRPADSGGLEELFLSLTAENQREQGELA